MTCEACERNARFMAADPEMYRGDDTRCDGCKAKAKAKAQSVELAELRARVAWRPIETAPKDGMWVALWSADGGVTAGFWGPTYFDSDHAWIRYHHRSDFDEVIPRPTHWLPLPEPPAIESALALGKEGGE